MIMPPPIARELFAVRDAIAAHLGAGRARDLGLEVQASCVADVIEVSTPSAGFVITRKAFEHDNWRTTLAAQLDALVEAAPQPQSADPGSFQEGRDGTDQP